jgi:hypothetical protein
LATVDDFFEGGTAGEGIVATVRDFFVGGAADD